MFKKFCKLIRSLFGNNNRVTPGDTEENNPLPNSASHDNHNSDDIASIPSNALSSPSTDIGKMTLA